MMNKMSINIFLLVSIFFSLFKLIVSDILVNVYPNDFRDPKTSWSAPSERFTMLEFNMTELALEEERNNQTKNRTVISIPRVNKEDRDFRFTSSQCQVESWNDVRTEAVPNRYLHDKFLKDVNISSLDTNHLNHSTLSPLAAFATKNYITVTLTSESFFGSPVVCRYFDCHREEIKGSEYESILFPKSTVFCPRRIGAKFISVSRKSEKNLEYPVAIQPRFQPQHYLTVCMSTLYGEEPKFLQIAEFIEYYKAQGATFFHIYVRNVSDYDQILLDDYVRTGAVEIIKMHDHYWRDDFMWQNVQVNDCHHRNKYFSKWTVISSINDRIKMENDNIPTIKNLLDQIPFPSNMTELRFKTQWVVKTGKSPARYTNDKEMTAELLFQKYKNVTDFDDFWSSDALIMRPERVAHVKMGQNSTSDIDTIFDSLLLKRTIVNETIAVLRRYRDNDTEVLSRPALNVVELNPVGPRWFNLKNPLMEISEAITSDILQRLSWVYGTVDLSEELKTEAREKYCSAGC